MRRLTSAPRGMSVLEILVALSVFATGLLMLVGAVPVSYQTQGQARELSLATSVAANRLEAIKAMPFADITSANLVNSSGQVPVTVNGVNTSFNYASQYTVSTVTPTRKAVSVMITWTTPSGLKYVRLDTEVGQ